MLCEAKLKALFPSDSVIEVYCRSLELIIVCKHINNFIYLICKFQQGNFSFSTNSPRYK